MGFRLIPKSFAQAISGSVNSTGQVVVLAGAAQIAYTCPAGKRATVRMTALIKILSAVQNLRFRAAGVLIYQRGTAEVILLSNPPPFIDMGVFNLDEGDEISCTTSNVGTEGGTMILNAIVTSEIPR